MKPIFDSTLHEILNKRLGELENHFDADFLFYYGPITDSLDKPFRDLVEELKAEPDTKDTLFIMLNTPGGSAETVERLVKITRHHYQTVNFIVPDAAYSAGTIFCLSGDAIYMDYSSSLGPIDPQVYNGKNWVPALGYLDKVEELINKSIAGTISQAELIMLREQDLAMLRRHEQARDLTIALLKEWLVQYKFKNWNTHNSTGNPVTPQEKEDRATEIARDLGDNKIWHSHGRSIGVSALTHILKLKIEDYSGDAVLTKIIREYNDLICQYIGRNNGEMFFHTRKFI
ncbi:SDH family Clp fold serine proteinase [Winogradskyella marincola]|uniref:Serine dehydrogenasease n=1 Tax=Winogradskyella marincola TaxID=3037795 RepID=A0ABT6G2Q9_9FLAO|nr:serine dehydrogenasease [Winogradskyella sp. YYF002]MDG4716318.1 serine dehydrogenasease [Winogradskyella sp. YYF002]